MKSVRLAVMSLACLLVFASAAHGISGPIALGFLESYVAPDGTECIHRGVDVALAEGAAIAAPVDGVVRFAGRVPGPHGGSIIAVSIESDVGIVSLLPLAGAVVETGQRVSSGTVVGTLGQGDPSSSSSHLHVGLKRGSTYLDPSWLVVPVVAPEPPRPSPEPAASPLPAPATPAPIVTAPVAPVHVPEPVPVAPAPVQSPSGVPAIGPVLSTPVGAPGTVEQFVPAHTGGVTQGAPSGIRPDATQPVIAPGVTLVGAGAPAGGSTRSMSSAASPLTAPVRTVSALSAMGGGLASAMGRLFGTSKATAVQAATPTQVAASGASASKTRSRAGNRFGSDVAGARLRPSSGRGTVPIAAVGRPLASLDKHALGYGLALVAAALCGSALLLTRRALTRSISGQAPVSDRLGIVLQHLKAGDTLCGLTSCPGPLPSQSRGH